MNTRTVNINVTTEDIQAMVDTFHHLHNTLGTMKENDNGALAAHRLVARFDDMLLKVVNAHPDTEAIKAATHRPAGYDPMQPETHKDANPDQKNSNTYLSEHDKVWDAPYHGDNAYYEDDAWKPLHDPDNADYCQNDSNSNTPHQHGQT